MTFRKSSSSIILSSEKSPSMYCILLSITVVSIMSTGYYIFSSTYYFRSFLTEYEAVDLQNKFITIESTISVDPILKNLTFSVNSIYHHDGIAYDYYSQNELGQSKASYQWQIWPLPNGTNRRFPSNSIESSPSVVSNLSFVDVIYVISDPRLTERHDNLKKCFDHQGMSIQSISWRMKWNDTTCNSNLSHSYVYQRLNLRNESLDKEQQRRCALVMKHVDVWYEMAERKVGLALILEDDARFVTFFKEKLSRMINRAIHSGILSLNETCVKSEEQSISDDERINQNGMIVIGTCLNIRSPYFQSHLTDAPPILTTHKSSSSRCAHAYLLTSCSAQALVDQIHVQKNGFVPPDHLQNDLFRLSSTLQSFWIDPPLAYQGNQVIDLDNLETYKRRTYK